MKSYRKLISRNLHRPFLEFLEDRLNPGTGTFDPATGTFNFSVALMFDATATELQELRDRFEAASNVLSDATDGQHRFGTVCIYNNAGDQAFSRADYWVHAENGRAYATAGQYGVPGAHINIYRDDVGGGDFTGDAYTIAHEFVHHAYAITDEYSGPVLDAAGNPVDANGDGYIDSQAAECAIQVIVSAFLLRRSGRIRGKLH